MAGGTATLTSSVEGGAQNGLFLSSGTLNLVGSQIEANTSAGLFMTGGVATFASTAGAVTALDGNTGDGVDLQGGSLTSTGADLSGNGANGLHVTGMLSPSPAEPLAASPEHSPAMPRTACWCSRARAPASLCTACPSPSMDCGVELSNAGSPNLATVTIDTASTITGNGATTPDANIRAASGTLTLSNSTVTGAIDGYGLNIVGANTTLDTVAVTNNEGLAGINIDNAAGAAIAIDNCTIASNVGDGVRVHQAPAAISVLDINGGTIGGYGNTGATGNDGIGLNLLGDTGAIFAEVNGVTISHNVGKGMVVNPATGAGRS